MAKNKILIKSDDFYGNAYFGWQDRDSALLALGEGYFNAANDLVNIALKEGKKESTQKLDTYIFPIMFLYRHSLEITLKHIYVRWCGTMPNSKNNHDLITVWDKILNKFKMLDLGIIDNKCSKQIRDLLIEVNKYEDRYDYFRFLMDKDGKLYSKKQHQYIDYSNLKAYMSNLYEILYGVYCEVDEYLSGDRPAIY